MMLNYMITVVTGRLESRSVHLMINLLSLANVYVLVRKLSKAKSLSTQNVILRKSLIRILKKYQNLL